MQPILQIFLLLLIIYFSFWITWRYEANFGNVSNDFEIGFILVGALIATILFVSKALNKSKENYSNSDQICPNCNRRIVTAQVYADPENSSGLGWVL